MGAKTRSCKACDATLQLTRMPELTGQAGDWQVRLLHFPVLACPEGHERREPHEEFHVAWSEDIGFGPFGLWAKTRGLLRRQAACPRCQQALSPTSESTRRLDLRQQGTFAFSVEIRGPLLACDACGNRALRQADAGELFEAFANALSGAAIETY
jgi:hypothetical protein